jgi:hypothetical protein
MTSALVQLWTEPQCAQVNLCVFSFDVAQRFSSTVFPVSMSLDVDGHRISRLFIPALGFAFCRRGGSKRNRRAMLKADKRSALWRYRRETSPSLLDRQWLNE